MSGENAKMLAENIGPLMLGFALNWGLYGALCVQVFYYYMAFPKDRVVSKALVYGLLLLETAQSILVAHDIFGPYVINYGNLSVLSLVRLLWLDMPVMTGIISFIVQIYFALRVYRISGSMIAGAMIIMFALVQSVASFICGALMLDAGDFIKLPPQYFVSSTVRLAGNAACDLIIAVLLTYFLLRKNTGFKETRILIAKIVRLSIETGSMTAAVAVLDIVLFLHYRNQNFHAAPGMILSKLYTISMVTSLNARLRIVHGRDEDPTNIVVSVPESLRFGSAGGDGHGLQTRQRGALDVDSGRTVGSVVTVNIERERRKNDNGRNSLEEGKEDNVRGKELVNG